MSEVENKRRHIGEFISNWAAQNLPPTPPENAGDFCVYDPKMKWARHSGLSEECAKRCLQVYLDRDPEKWARLQIIYTGKQ